VRVSRFYWRSPVSQLNPSQHLSQFITNLKKVPVITAQSPCILEKLQVCARKEA
jgi:hypothetical protein